MRKVMRSVMALAMSVALCVGVTGCGNYKRTDRNRVKETEGELETLLADEYDFTELEKLVAEMEKQLNDFYEYVRFNANEIKLDELQKLVGIDEATLLNNIDGIVKEFNELKFENDDYSKAIKSAAKDYFTVISEFVDSYTGIEKMVEDYGEALGYIINYHEGDANSVKQAYLSAKTGVEKLKNMVVPDYFSQVISNFADILTQYKEILSSQYSAVVNQDVLQDSACQLMYERIRQEINDQGSEVVDAIYTEYEQMKKLLADDVMKRSEEILNNIKNAEGGKRVVFENKNTNVSVNLEYKDTVYPSAYTSMYSLLKFDLVSDNENKDVLVKVSIPGFAQDYEQKITVGRQITRVYVKPNVLNDADLTKQQNVQLEFSVTDADSGKVYAQETKTLKIMSVNDFILSEDEYGVTTYENLLAWVTPEASEIVELNRVAVDMLTEFTDGVMKSMVGYQNVEGLDEINTTASQVFSVLLATSEKNVRYNYAAYSLGENMTHTQRVYLPKQTLDLKSGICIDLSILTATALQSAGFHTMILLLLSQGHAQVAVETWRGSGEYILVETTNLPLSVDDDINDVISYLDNEEWQEYIGNDVVIDCNMATAMGILPIQQ